MGIKLDDGSVKEFDFSRDIEEWDEENTVVEEVLEPCCPVFHTNVLTKAEAKKRTGLKDAMDKEIKKLSHLEPLNVLLMKANLPLKPGGCIQKTMTPKVKPLKLDFA